MRVNRSSSWKIAAADYTETFGNKGVCTFAHVYSADVHYAQVTHSLVDLSSVNGNCRNASLRWPNNQWLKWFCEAGGAHLTNPGWSKPHTHSKSNPTNLALFRHKITLYRFNRGAHTIAGGSNGSRGLSPPSPLTLTTSNNTACKVGPERPWSEHFLAHFDH